MSASPSSSGPDTLDMMDPSGHSGATLGDDEIPDAHGSADPNKLSSDSGDGDASSNDEDISDAEDHSGEDMEVDAFDDEPPAKEDLSTTSVTRNGSFRILRERLVFDESGDLCLMIGKDKETCRVCSRALARASRVFKSMLYGGFAESRENFKKGEWVIHLPDDDINAMEILLNIIHGAAHNIPKKIVHEPSEGNDHLYKDLGYCCFDESPLYPLALAADKYGLTQILRPWAQSWLDECRNYDRWCPELLWAAWLLGDEDILIKQLEAATVSAMPDYDKDDIVLHDGYDREIRLPDTLSAPYEILGILDVWDHIPAARLRVLKLYLDHLKLFLQEPMRYMDPGCAWHVETESSTDRATIVKTLEVRLDGHEMFPLPEPQEWIYDVTQMQYWLFDYVKCEVKEDMETAQLQCSHCSPYKRLFDTLEAVQGTAPLFRLTESQRAHLARKRKESGITEPKF